MVWLQQKFKELFYDGSNDDPGLREYDWFGELVSVKDKSDRFAIPYLFRDCFEYYSKSNFETIFRATVYAEILIDEDSEIKIHT